MGEAANNRAGDDFFVPILFKAFEREKRDQCSGQKQKAASDELYRVGQLSHVSFGYNIASRRLDKQGPVENYPTYSSDKSSAEKDKNAHIVPRRNMPEVEGDQKHVDWMQGRKTNQAKSLFALEHGLALFEKSVHAFVLILA